MRGLVVLLALAASAGWTSTNLGTPPGHPDAFVNAVGVNAHGTAIGNAGIDAGQIGFVWRNGKLTVSRTAARTGSMRTRSMTAATSSAMHRSTGSTRWA
jgi:hypothetical protein